MRADTQVDWIEPNLQEPLAKPLTGPHIPDSPRQPREFRIHRALPVLFSTVQHGDFAGTTRDVSSGGLALVVREALPPLTRLRLVVTLPDGPTQPMDGLVRWTRRSPRGEMGIALEFPDRRLGSLLALPATRVAPGLFVPRAVASGHISNRTGSMSRPRLTRRPRPLAVRFGIGRQLLPGIATDISARGLGLRASALPPPGSEVRLEITLPAAGIARAEGAVAWMKSPSEYDPLARGGLFIQFADEAFFSFVLQDQAGPRILTRPGERPARKACT